MSEPRDHAVPQPAGTPCVENTLAVAPDAIQQNAELVRLPAGAAVPRAMGGASLKPASEHPIAASRMGVYAIRNASDGAVYVGSATDIDARWEQHRSALTRVCHPSDPLQAAWQRGGAEAFELVVLEWVQSREELARSEQWWIDRYSAAGLYRVYNSQTRAIRRCRKPLSLEQAARRLRLTPRRLLLWVVEGRVPCRHASSPESPLADSEPVEFDREIIDDACERMRHNGDGVGRPVPRLKSIQSRIRGWLHVDQ